MSQQPEMERCQGATDPLPVRVNHEGAEFVTIDRPDVAHGLSAYDAAYLELALRRSLVQLPDTCPVPLGDAALAATWRDAWSSLGWLAAPLLRLAQ